MPSSSLAKPDLRIPEPLPPPRKYPPPHPPLAHDCDISDSDVIVAGSDDDEDNTNALSTQLTRASKRRRIETYAIRYLAGEQLYIHSARLKGPVVKNPWVRNENISLRNRNKRKASNETLTVKPKKIKGLDRVVEATPTHRQPGEIGPVVDKAMIVEQQALKVNTESTELMLVRRRPRKAIEGDEDEEDGEEEGSITWSPQKQLQNSSAPLDAVNTSTSTRKRGRKKMATRTSTRRKEDSQDESYRPDALGAQSKRKPTKKPKRPKATVSHECDSTTNETKTAGKRISGRKKPVAELKSISISKSTTVTMPMMEATTEMPQPLSVSEQPPPAMPFTSEASSQAVGRINTNKACVAVPSEGYDPFLEGPKQLDNKMPTRVADYISQMPSFSQPPSSFYTPIRGLAGRPQDILRKETGKVLSRLHKSGLYIPRMDARSQVTGAEGDEECNGERWKEVRMEQGEEKSFSEGDAPGSFEFTRVGKAICMAPEPPTPLIGLNLHELAPRDVYKQPARANTEKQAKLNKPRFVEFSGLSPFGGGQVVSKKGDVYKTPGKTVPACKGEMSTGTLRAKPMVPTASEPVTATGISEEITLIAWPPDSTPRRHSSEPVLASLAKGEAAQKQMPLEKVISVNPPTLGSDKAETSKFSATVTPAPITKSHLISASQPSTSGSWILSTKKGLGESKSDDIPYPAIQSLSSPDPTWLSTQHQLSAAKKGFMSAILDSPFSPGIGSKGLRANKAEHRAKKESKLQQRQRQVPCPRPQKGITSLLPVTPTVTNLAQNGDNLKFTEEEQLSSPQVGSSTAAISRTSNKKLEEINPQTAQTTNEHIDKPSPLPTAAPPFVSAMPPQFSPHSSPSRPKSPFSPNHSNGLQPGLGEREQEEDKESLDFSPFKTFDTPTKSQFGTLPTSFSPPLHYSLLPTLREETESGRENNSRTWLFINGTARGQNHTPQGRLSSISNNFLEGKGKGKIKEKISDEFRGEGEEKVAILEPHPQWVMGLDLLPQQQHLLQQAQQAHVTSQDSPFQPSIINNANPAAVGETNGSYDNNNNDDSIGRIKAPQASTHSPKTPDSPSKKLAGDMLDILGGGLWDLDEEVRKMKAGGDEAGKDSSERQIMFKNWSGSRNALSSNSTRSKSGSTVGKNLLGKMGRWAG